MTKNYFIPYFTKEELACRSSGGLVLAEGFSEKLVELRTKFERPMIVTSCCRSQEHNQKIGGAPNSFHIYDRPRHGFIGTCAIDIAIKDEADKGDLLALAWSLGWSLGVHKLFLHLDRRVDYTNMKQRVFDYNK